MRRYDEAEHAYSNLKHSLSEVHGEAATSEHLRRTIDARLARERAWVELQIQAAKALTMED
jgi:hypothetical protein